MNSNDKNLRRLERQFFIGAGLVAPLAPLLALQGQITRWKVGLLPDAAGEHHGRFENGREAVSLFVIGESTVAGLGARTHEFALAGQFARHLGLHLGRSVDWDVVGKNGVTARRTIDELLPRMPPQSFDYILIGLGGNDVMKLSPPRRWRRDMTELIGRLREACPHAAIFITNCPMIVMSPVIPEPVKSILWRLSRMHDANIREFTRDMPRVFYFPQPVGVELEGFFADGIHPSEKGYDDWSRAMIEYFAENYEW
jgi:lysophospholipase L1-like esterase